MIKWLLLFALFYVLYKSFAPIMGILRFNRSLRKKQRKNNMHKKFANMDIQDAEFDDCSK